MRPPVARGDKQSGDECRREEPTAAQGAPERSTHIRQRLGRHVEEVEEGEAGDSSGQEGAEDAPTRGTADGHGPTKEGNAKGPAKEGNAKGTAKGMEGSALVRERRVKSSRELRRELEDVLQKPTYMDMEPNKRAREVAVKRRVEVTRVRAMQWFARINGIPMPRQPRINPRMRLY